MFGLALVKKRKKRKELEEEEKKRAHFFVLYKLEKSENWTYPDLFEGWSWVGSGSTGLDHLPREEQLSGPKEGSLKQKGVVQNYRLINEYSWVIKERRKEKTRRSSKKQTKETR